MIIRLWYVIAVAPFLCGLGGCGVSVPEIAEAWDQDFQYKASDKSNPIRITGSGQIEFEIRKRVWCDLKRAVHEAQTHTVTEIDDKGRRTVTKLIPEDWVAEASLNLEVDESSALNPGVSFNTPLHTAITHFTGEGAPTSTSAVTYGATFPFLATPQSYSLGLGGTLSSTATRIDKFDAFYSIKSLSSPITDKKNVCLTYLNEDDANDPFVAVVPDFKPAKTSPLILSDLGITDWLIDAMFHDRALHSDQESNPTTPASLEKEREKYRKQGFTPAEVTQIMAAKASGGSGSGGGSKPDTVSLEIKFIIVTNGNITPTWKLVRVSANTSSSPLFSTGRTRTHDLIVTIGPKNADTSNTHLASQIGQAVSSGNRTTLTSP